MGPKLACTHNARVRCVNCGVSNPEVYLQNLEEYGMLSSETRADTIGLPTVSPSSGTDSSSFLVDDDHLGTGVQFRSSGDHFSQLDCEIALERQRRCRETCV